jgi:lysozyme family protein
MRNPFWSFIGLFATDKIKTMPTPYTDIYNKATIRPQYKTELDTVKSRILSGKQRYEAVAATLGNGIPWWFIGITHFMEAGLFWPKQFDYHLHCGDPLTARTIHVPKGRPVHNPGHMVGQPSATNPYTWEESALDALTFMGYDKVKDWSLENCLVLFEKFNGLGYKKKGVPSPYLWSYTTAYEKGKYVLDGVYDPNKVSKQPGCAALMKVLGV